ncbi:MAG: response regulator, partial [Planctomycetota bacterium]
MASKPINLLLVDDDLVDRRLITKALARFSPGVQFNIQTAGTMSETLEHLSSNKYDVVLLDLNLPDSDGIGTVQKVHDADSNIAIVVLTGLPDEKMGLQTIEKGAGDYLVKGKFSDDALMRAIRYAIERKRPEQRLKRAAQEWRTTFDSITEFILILDRDFKILRVNRAVSDALGVEPQELIGKTCYDVYNCTDHNPSNCPHAQTLRTRKPSSIEFFQRQLGIHLEVTISPIINEYGEVGGSVHISKDITERKRAEEEHREQERLKSEFAASVSHEIRTPLSIFKNIVSNALAGVQGPLNPKLRESLEMANGTIKRLARIINNFLDISKIEAGRMKLHLAQFDLWSAISDTVKALSLLSDEKGIELNADRPDCELIINADRDRIEQTLINLISNAIKFTPQGGHVSVRAKNLGTMVAVEIEDDGPGIGTNDIDKIFNRFVQIEKQ